MTNKNKPNQYIRMPGELKYLLKNKKGEIIMKFLNKSVGDSWVEKLNKEDFTEEYNLERIK